MSLKPELIGPFPEETARLAKAVFPEGSTFIKMRDELGTLYQDEQFAPCSLKMVSQQWLHGDWPWSPLCNSPRGYPIVKRPMLCALVWIGSMH